MMTIHAGPRREREGKKFLESNFDSMSSHKRNLKVSSPGRPGIKKKKKRKGRLRGAGKLGIEFGTLTSSHKSNFSGIKKEREEKEEYEEQVN